MGPRRNRALRCPWVLVHDDAMASQPEQAVTRLLEKIVASHLLWLGDNLVGIYLHGFRATGDHGPSSDVDYLVVVESRLNLDEKPKLVAQLRELSKCASAHGIEMSVITRATLLRFCHPSPFEFHFSRDWLERYDRGQVDLELSHTDPDLASHVVQPDVEGAPARPRAPQAARGDRPGQLAVVLHSSRACQRWSSRRPE